MPASVFDEMFIVASRIQVIPRITPHLGRAGTQVTNIVRMSSVGSLANNRKDSIGRSDESNDNAPGVANVSPIGEGQPVKQVK